MSGLNVMFWNAQGVRGKWNELIDVLSSNNIDIACVSESHLTAKTILKDDPTYFIIRQDRTGHMGGLLTFVKKHIPFSTWNDVKTNLIEYSGILTRDTRAG